MALTGAAFGAVLLAAACGGGDDSTATKTATTAPQTTATAAATATKGGSSNGASAEEKKVEVQLTDNVYVPKDLTVPAGAKVKFHLNNTGTAIHNMHILSEAGEGKDFTSELMVNPGKTSEFEATFTKKGTYKFQCDFHVPDMVGTITVS